MMRRFACVAALVASAAALSGQDRSAKTLNIYVVDVEGGNATLVVSSTGESLLTFLRRAVSWTLLPFGVMASLTIILVVVWDRSPFLAGALVGPLVAVDLYERWLHG